MVAAGRGARPLEGAQGTAPTFEEEHYAEGAIEVTLELNTKQRKPRQGVTREIRERIEREADAIVGEVQG